MKRKNLTMKEMKTILRNYKFMPEEDLQFLEKCTGKNRYDLKKALEINCYKINNLSITYKKQLRKDINNMTPAEKQIVADVNGMSIEKVIEILDECIEIQRKDDADKRAYNKEWAKRKPEFERKFYEENGAFDDSKTNFMKLMKYHNEMSDAMIELAKEMGMHIKVSSPFESKSC